MAEACVSKFGGVDISVNCAGAGMGGDILQLPVEVIDEAIGPKFYGYLRMAQLAVPHMQKKRWGRIVFVAVFLLAFVCQVHFVTDWHHFA